MTAPSQRHFHDIATVHNLYVQVICRTWSYCKHMTYMTVINFSGEGF